MKRRGVAAVLVVAMLSCAVPELRFEPDASSDSAGRPDSGKRDSGSPNDGAFEAETQTGNGCPGSPPGAGVCCIEPKLMTDVPCIGAFCEAGCASCIANCGVAKVCCARNATHTTCRPIEAGCP